MIINIIHDAPRNEVRYNLETGECYIYLADENKLSRGIEKAKDFIAAFEKEGAMI